MRRCYICIWCRND